jgi:hypothetical protein
MDRRWRLKKIRTYRLHGGMFAANLSRGRRGSVGVGRGGVRGTSRGAALGGKKEGRGRQAEAQLGNDSEALMRKVVLFLTTCALAGGMASTASAESFTAQSLVQSENGNCGHYVVGGGAIIGTAKFVRTVNKLTVTYKAKHLAKSSTYELYFYNATGGACEFLGAPAKAVTTSTGALSVTGQMEVPAGDYEFFVDAVNTEGKAPFGADSMISVLP